VLDKDVILIGYSGHSYVILDTAIENNFKIIGYTEKTEQEKNPYQLSYLGSEDDSDFVGWEKEIDYIIGIGDNALRHKIATTLKNKNKIVKTVIHSSASISKKAQISQGVFVNRNVSINAFAKIGENVILNTGVIIEHECEINECAHIAPGCVLAGNVKIGKCSFIGANSVVKQGVEIGENVIIGAGSVVIRNVPDNETWVGNPAKKMNK